MCVATAVERATGLRAQVKWPNDILVGGKKVAGILTECSSDAARSMFAVVGIGLNVNHDAMPADIAHRAASLRQLTGRTLDRSALAAAILGELTARLPEVDAHFSTLPAARSSATGSASTPRISHSRAAPKASTPRATCSSASPTARCAR